MRSHGEGKLLARVEGFLSPWGSERNNRVQCTLLAIFCGSKKCSRCSPVPALRFTPIRVREKRMNTHKTLLAGRKLSKYKQINCKNIFTSMESFFLARHHRSKGRNVSARVMGCVAKAN
jgi:hypothetical protein